jgi:hypothetical protein
MTLTLRYRGEKPLEDDELYIPYISYFNYRVNRNRNVLACIVGGTGSGKSYAALWLAEKIQKLSRPGVPFTIDQVAFKASQFMNMVSGENKLPAKSVIIWDEVGVAGYGMNAKRSMSTLNMALNNIFQTFRSRQYIVILTTPDFMFIDKSTRKLLHFYLEPKMIDYEKGENHVTIQEMQYSPRYGKIYHKHCIVLQPLSPAMKVKKIITKMPSKDLQLAYDKEKEKFNDEVFKDTDLKVTEHESMGELTELQSNVYELNQKGLLHKEIAKELGMTINAISKHLIACKHKGYQIKRNYTGSKQHTPFFQKVKEYSELQAKNKQRVDNTI